MRRGDHARLVGRDAEMAKARAALDRVAPASGHALLITGEAGIGKSALGRALVEEAGDRFLVAAEAASELERDLPFAPLVRALRLRPDAADGHAAEVGRLLTAESGDAELLRLRVIEGIADLVERWSLDRPVLLVVEDLHWADEATLQALDRLARRLAHTGLLLVGTVRPHPRPAGLGALERTLVEVDATRIDLGPLPDEATITLAGQVLGAEPGPNLTAALGRTGGNPLFVTELLAAAATQVDRAGGTADLAAVGVPESVRLAILRTLSFLPEPAVELLRVASVLGTRFALRHLAVTVDRPEADVIESLAPALAAGVVTDAGERLAFRHDLVRDAVYDDQPHAVRAAWHRQAVERLRAAGTPAEDLVAHLLRGDWHGVPEAAGWLAEAGRTMRPRSLPTAIDLLTRALDLTSDDPHLRLDLAEALTATGRTDDARDVAQPVLDTPLDMLDETVRDRLVVLDRLVGLVDPGTTTAKLDAHLDALERSGLSAAGRARADASRAWLRWGEGEVDQARTLAETALDAAVAAGDHAAAASLAGLLASIAADAAMYSHARAALAHARAVPAAPELQLSAAAYVAVVLGNDPALQAEADRLVADAVVLANRTGLHAHTAILDAVAAVNAQRRGEWDDAAARYDAALGSFPEQPADPTMAGFFARAARLDIHRDDLERAAERLETAVALQERARAAGWEADGFVFVDLASAELHLARGDADAALEAVERLRAFVDRRGIGKYHAVVLPSVASIAWQASRPDQARAAVERAEAWQLTRPESPPPFPVVGWCRARLEGDAGRLEELVAWFDEHARVWELRPRVREDAAAVHADAGDRDRAVQRLSEALSLWTAAGARRDVARVRKALRGLGVHRGRGLAAGGPPTGWASLTPTEWRVVALVAEGLVYRDIGERLFVSRRTVETHIAHVFAKLGASSRRELSDLLDSYEARIHLAALR